MTGSATLNVYADQVHIPALGFTASGRFAGVQLAAGGQAHKVLLGRSLLRHIILTYDGRTGNVQLAV
jgi:hypothetical protein